ncbi:hypothetical protein HMPREF1862_00401 [Varibaculum cambriense]|uniref:Uncharacterized protein n=1 Tax=Varibaculum cambriense TaxID=184870 RepID=A0AB34X178_9ACTO|nr:hypothetical protein HMPREF1862_00401 [Varibaculum cambriense]
MYQLLARGKWKLMIVLGVFAPNSLLAPEKQAATYGYLLNWL